MYVACPSCKTLYPVSAEYLRLAAGQVRCSVCENRFDASKSVFDDPQEALDYQYPVPQAIKEEIDDLVDRALDSGAELPPAVEEQQEEQQKNSRKNSRKNSKPLTTNMNSGVLMSTTMPGPLRLNFTNSLLSSLCRTSMWGVPTCRMNTCLPTTASLVPARHGVR